MGEVLDVHGTYHGYQSDYVNRNGNMKVVNSEVSSISENEQKSITRGQHR